MRRSLWLAAFLSGIAASSAVAQTSGCKELLSPPGTSGSQDRSWSRCSLDATPRLLTPSELPAPEYGTYAGMSLFIVVNPDGRVDSALTRLWSVSDGPFAERALKTIRGWRFEPGTRAGQPVRWGFTMHVRSDFRVDTVASSMKWNHRPMQPLTDPNAERADSLIGRWFDIDAPTRFTSSEEEKIYASVLEDLKRSGVALRTDSALPRIHRTENGRAVVTANGDRLPRFPLDLSGRPYLHWTARCVGYVAVRPESPMRCDVGPAMTEEERREWANRRRRPPSDTSRSPRRARDSAVARVYLTTSGATTIDTLPPRVLRIPRLAERALTETPGPCGDWQVFTPDRGRELFVLHGEIGGDWLMVTDAAAAAPRHPPPGAANCGGQRRFRDFFAFVPGGVGDTPREPMTLCFLGCAMPYTLIPGRHVVEPTFAFSLDDVRATTRASARVDMRIVVEGAPPETFPIFVTRRGGSAPFAAFGRRLSSDTWEYPFINGDGSGTAVQYTIYLFRR